MKERKTKFIVNATKYEDIPFFTSRSIKAAYDSKNGRKSISRKFISRSLKKSGFRYVNTEINMQTKVVNKKYLLDYLNERALRVVETCVKYMHYAHPDIYFFDETEFQSISRPRKQLYRIRTGRFNSRFSIGRSNIKP